MLQVSVENCLVAICYKNYTQLMQIWPSNSPFYAVMKGFEIEKFLKEFLSISKIPLEFLAFYI